MGNITCILVLHDNLGFSRGMHVLSLKISKCRHTWNIYVLMWAKYLWQIYTTLYILKNYAKILNPWKHCWHTSLCCYKVSKTLSVNFIKVTYCNIYIKLHVKNSFTFCLKLGHTVCVNVEQQWLKARRNYVDDCTDRLQVHWQEQFNSTLRKFKCT